MKNSWKGNEKTDLREGDRVEIIDRHTDVDGSTTYREVTGVLRKWHNGALGMTAIPIVIEPCGAVREPHGWTRHVQVNERATLAAGETVRILAAGDDLPDLTIITRRGISDRWVKVGGRWFGSCGRDAYPFGEYRIEYAPEPVKAVPF